MKPHLLRSSAALLVFGHWASLTAIADPCDPQTQHELESDNPDPLILDPFESPPEQDCAGDAADAPEFNLPLSRPAALLNVQEGALSDPLITSLNSIFPPRTTSLGFRAQAAGANSIALGAWSRSIEDYTLSIGRTDDPATDEDETLLRRLVNLQAGEGDNDAVNVAQLRDLEDEVGGNTRDIEQTESAIAALDLRFLGATRYARINADGVPASATGLDAIAIGEGARATKGNSMAIGTRAIAQFDNFMALGFGAQTSRANQMAIGTATNTYTLRGLLSPASRAVQTGDLQLVTVDADGNLASDGGQTVSGLQSQVSTNARDITVLQTGAKAQIKAIETLQTQTVQNKTAMEVNRAAISQNRTAIGETQAELLQLTDTTKDLHQTSAANRTAIEANAARSAQNQTEIGRNTRAIEGVSGRVDRTEAAIASNQRGVSNNRAATQQNASGINTKREHQPASYRRERRRHHGQSDVDQAIGVGG
ncbi:MAG: hypothetical protein AAFP81_18035 [Pseudomonadota bacterium]